MRDGWKLRANPKPAAQEGKRVIFFDFPYLNVHLAIEHHQILDFWDWCEPQLISVRQCQNVQYDTDL